MTIEHKSKWGEIDLVLHRTERSEKSISCSGCYLYENNLPISTCLKVNKESTAFDIDACTKSSGISLIWVKPEA
jgi:hypothetical protein